MIFFSGYTVLHCYSYIAELMHDHVGAFLLVNTMINVDVKHYNKSQYIYTSDKDESFAIQQI